MLIGSQKNQQLRALKKGMEHKTENTFVILYKST